MGWYMKGVCHSQLGAHFAAEKAYTVCIALKPEYAASYQARGEVNMWLQKFADAERDLTRALELDSNLLPALQRRAWIRTELKNYEGAIADLTEAMKRDDAPTVLWFDRSKVYTILKRPDDAKCDMDEGMKREPTDDLSYCRRSYYRILSGDLTGALKDCDRALELNPRCLAALQNRQNIFAEKQGNYAAAVPVLRQMIEYYPDYVAAHMGLAVNLARIGEVGEAINEARYCLDGNRSAGMLYKIGSMYAIASKFQPDLKSEAFRLLRESVLKGFDNAKEFATDPDLDPIRNNPKFKGIVELMHEGAKEKTTK
jgi:tetratricopeptide (TPR) repeat protein